MAASLGAMHRPEALPAAPQLPSRPAIPATRFSLALFKLIFRLKKTKNAVACPFGGSTFNGKVLKVKNLTGAPSYPIPLVMRSSSGDWKALIQSSLRPLVRYAGKKIYGIIWEFFPTWGGVFPIPKTQNQKKSALKSP